MHKVRQKGKSNLEWLLQSLLESKDIINIYDNGERPM